MLLLYACLVDGGGGMVIGKDTNFLSYNNLTSNDDLNVLGFFSKGINHFLFAVVILYNLLLKDALILLAEESIIFNSNFVP